MTLPTESAEMHARPMKSGTPPSVPADVCLDTTLLEAFVRNATLKLKSTTKEPNAATALKASKKYQDKDAMESAHPSAVQTKTGLEEDVSASQATTLSTTSAPNAQKDRSTMFTKDSAECNAEAIRSTTSTVENATAPMDTTLSKELALDVCLVRPTMSTLKPAASYLAKDSTNTSAKPPSNACANPNT